MSKRGFSILLILIIGLFIVAPVVFWLTLPKEEEQETVMGISNLEDLIGVSVSVSSSEGTWDLNKSLCSNYDDCLATLNSGKKLSTVGGGTVQNHQVIVEYRSDWAEYEYLKVYLKTGWGSMGGSFVVSNIGNVVGTKKEVIEENGTLYEVVLIPLSEIQHSFISGPSFSSY